MRRGVNMRKKVHFTWRVSEHTWFRYKDRSESNHQTIVTYWIWYLKCWQAFTASFNETFFLCRDYYISMFSFLFPSFGPKEIKLDAKKKNASKHLMIKHPLSYVQVMLYLASLQSNVWLNWSSKGNSMTYAPRLAQL